MIKWLPGRQKILKVFGAVTLAVFVGLENLLALADVMKVHTPLAGLEKLNKGTKQCRYGETLPTLTIILFD